MSLLAFSGGTFLPRTAGVGETDGGSLHCFRDFP